MLILLWGLPAEGPMLAVHRELRRQGAPTIFLDQSKFLSTKIELEIGDVVKGSVRTRDEQIDLERITAAYLRPYDPRLLCENSHPKTLRRLFLLDDILSTWSQVTPAFIVNRLSSMAVNNSKPYQLQLIRKYGFKVPDTLITTDPTAAEQFWDSHGAVIYKSVSGTRSRVSRLCPEHRPRLADVASCPTQFQQYIAGRDYRVHVIGSETFASELICDADDYRYPAHHPVEIHRAVLPAGIDEKCRLLAETMNLPFAGVDLRRTVDDEWYCFEVNPSPAFTFYEQATRQPMARAVASLLASGGASTASNAVESENFSLNTILVSSGVVEPVAWSF
jgi:hypothetical protein